MIRNRGKKKTQKDGFECEALRSFLSKRKSKNLQRLDQKRFEERKLKTEMQAESKVLRPRDDEVKLQ
jgi:hypothetical protein